MIHFRSQKIFSHSFVCVTLLSFLFSQTPALAIDLEQGFSGPGATQAEYFNLNRDKRMTIRVNFVGGVARPGIHHVPDNTNLLDAVALAGGVQNDADPEKVLIKRKAKDKFETIEYDLADVLSDRDAPYPELRNNDTILIEGKSRTTENVILGLSIVGSIVAIVSGYLIIADKR